MNRPHALNPTSGRRLVNRRRTAAALVAVALSLAIGCSPRTDGEITLVFAAGNDPSGATEALIDEYNASHPGVTVKFQAMPANTDTQHDAYVTYLSSGASNIDLYSLDVIWTAEFARAGWVRRVPDALIDEDEFLRGPIESVTWEGDLYAVPWFTDAGVLYYRTDLLEEAGLAVPETWDQFLAACRSVALPRGMDGFVWQGARYEGLVCDFLEFLWGLGGRIEPDDLASRPEEVEDEIVETLEMMRGFIDGGISPPSVLTYKEEDSRRVFTEGHALFHRNWPYAWSMAEGAESKVRGRVGVAPLAHAAGETSYSTIGGWNVAVSAFTEHPDEAFNFLAYITDERALKLRAIEGAYLPTRSGTYEDPEVLEANPHFARFFEVFRNTRNRPRSPHYPRASDIIQENVHGALAGEIGARSAARAIVSELAEILGE
jgi:multiple sugar transport system substrate-binding protein